MISNSLSGLKKNNRALLATIVRTAKNNSITVEQVSHILKVSRVRAAQILARLTKLGWLSRVRQGLYLPVPLEATSSDVIIEEPWLLAQKLYAPCYIGGWSAAQYWNLTEQIFKTIIVMTTKKVGNRSPVIKNSEFAIRTISNESLFGLSTVWLGSNKVELSDATRTIVDLLNAPKLGGGINSVSEIVTEYLKSEYFKPQLLLEYIDKLGNKTVYKRLGFLLVNIAPAQTQLILSCKERISKGPSKLDPDVNSSNFSTYWNLWIPKGWVK